MTAELFTGSWGTVYAAVNTGRLDVCRDVLPVRISRGAPKFWPAADRFPALSDLMPEGWMLGIKDPERFGRAYRRKLHTIGLDRIQAQLDELAALYCRPLVLCCFEANPVDCHRGPDGFAGWFERKTGESIGEWGPPADHPMGRADRTLNGSHTTRVLRGAERTT